MFVLAVDSGVMYTRWGRTECPSGATVLYVGFVGGSWHNDVGGLSNPICLPDVPVYIETEQAPIYSQIYSTEYESRDKVFDIDTDDYDIPCVVCTAPRTSTIMIPATPNCPSGVTLEYSGYLMASSHNHNHPTDAICVDSNPETVLGSEENEDGALLYFVVADCHTSFMPCDPYKNFVPMSCAVCSL